MEKHILIPTDFSKNAWNAVSYALKVYSDIPCTLYLLNSFQLYHFTTDSVIEPEPGEKIYEEAKEVSLKGLDELSESIRTKLDNPKMQIETISTYNSVLGAVTDLLKVKDIDILIMGTKGERNTLNAIYGSNAVNILKNITQCPVLVIPEKITVTENSLYEIVFATNYKYFYKRREIKPLLEIAEKYKAPIRVVYINESGKLSQEQENNKEVLEDYFSDYVCTFHTLTHVKVATDLHSFIESRGSSLLAIYNRKHSLFSGIFKKSMVKELGFSPQVPVLVLQEHK